MVKQTVLPSTPDEWLQKLIALRGEDATQLLQVALDLYADKDEALLNHGLELAEVLLSLELDSETLAAALLYPLFKTHQIHYDIIAEKFGDRIKKMLSDAMQMQSLERFKRIAEHSHSQVENLRKILLAMVTDIRAVIIILADRLIMLRKFKTESPEQQVELAHQTLRAYAPLANRLGIWQLKWEMEDWCLRYLDPEAYKEIATALASKRSERELFIADAIKQLTHLLKQHQVPEFQVSGRIKHLYSIYNKMRRKGDNIDKIYDISAMRVLVPAVDDCYNVMGVLHHTWPHIPEEFDDYISNPKSNGYQSIHTVVIGMEDKPVEIQIRTYAMHEASELGVASHWHYKENVKSEANYKEKIALLRQVMAWQNEMSNEQPEKEEVAVSDIFADRVYVFTPMGDIIDLPVGATPLDFAYTIHSDVGNRCRGAKVNGKLVQLTTPLKTGDSVEIQTQKIAHPSRDWLNPQKGYITTVRARNHIQHWFRINEPAEKPAVPEPPKTKVKPKPASQHGMGTHTFSQNVSNYLTKFSRCCKPLPGDKVIGYITQKSGLSVHRYDCSNFNYLKSRNPDRVLEINLSGKTQEPFLIDMEIRGQTNSKLLNAITTTLANANIHIASITEQTSKVPGLSIWQLTIRVKAIEELHQSTQLLQHLPDVLEVRRL